MFFKLITKLQGSKLIGDSVKYTGLNFLEKSIPFLVLPILTRILPKGEVGYYILYQAILEIAVPILTLNIDSSILINFYKLNEKNFSIYFSNGLILFVLYFSAILIPLAILASYFSHWLLIPTAYFFIIYFIAFFQFLISVRQNLWRVNYKIKNYGIFTIGITILKNLLGLLLIFTTTLGWKGIILGHFVGYLVFGLYALYTFFNERMIIPTMTVSYLKDIFKIGFPLSLHRLGLWLGNAANRIIITFLLGSAATGSYGIGATFATIIAIIEDAITKAITPHLFEEFKVIDKNKERKIVKISYSIYLVILIISFSVFVVGYYGVGFIFGNEYINTRSFIFPLVLAAMFKGLYKFHVNYIFFSKQTLEITKITLTTGIFNLFLAFFLIKIKGLLGAAYSLVIISSIQYALTFYIGNRIMPMPWFSFLIQKKKI